MDEGPPPLTKDTQCGIGFIRGSLLQKFANKKAYVFIYGFTGLIFSASYAYFNGTITAMEKRFKIPSRTTGFITTGSDMSQLLTVVISYYAGKGHRPRWIAMGVYTVVLYCLMNALPHFMYGAGEEALSLTEEWEQGSNVTEAFNDRICNKKEGSKCIQGGDLAPQIILFAAQFISGIGGSLYYTLGVTYMDDNIKKSKTPALISLSYFIRMLGPAMGYTLASFCLSIYISPSLTPKITPKDPRWLGAWWLGWIIIGGSLFLFSTLLGLFPKTLPRAAQRKMMERKEKQEEDAHKHDMPSWDDLVKTMKKLLKNKTFMCNTLSSVFYFLGYMPYWIFMPKYIETNYKLSAADSSFITGTFGLIFSALGVLISGIVISKVKPKARSLAMWNVFVGAFSVLVIISYAFMGCSEDTQNPVVGLDLNATCRSDCNCEFTKYAPVCGNGVTYISACHAGCTTEVSKNGTRTFHNCACIAGNETDGSGSGGWASQGPCPIDCKLALIVFISAMCATKFTGATGRTSNFLVSVRCVDEKDKSAAMGLSVLFMSAFAFIPSPILFGHLIDTTCTVWGQTCSGKGNCWLYNGAQLRTVLNFTSAVFVTIGTLLDLGVWYYVKHLPIFDEEIGEEIKEIKKGDSDEPKETDKLTDDANEKNDSKLISNGI